MNTSQYRQQVADFRKRLTEFAVGEVPQGRRVMIDTTGSRTRVVPGTAVERMSLYGRRRYISIARVMALLEILRDIEDLPARPKPVEVEATGAYWQAFQGTTQAPACHTCPALLMLDGNLPTLMTSNIGLRRHVIVVFADCMIMPALVNKVDRALDDQVGWTAFETAAAEVINGAGVPWRQGLDRYASEMRAIFGDMLTILNGNAHFDDSDLQEQFEAVQAFYEGLFMTQIHPVDMANFVTRVRSEMAA